MEKKVFISEFGREIHVGLSTSEDSPHIVLRNNDEGEGRGKCPSKDAVLSIETAKGIIEQLIKVVNHLEAEQCQ